MEDDLSPSARLKALGLGFDVDEPVASTIWGNLLMIDGRVAQGQYPFDPSRQVFLKEHYYDAYHAIARSLVAHDSSDQLLYEVIPLMVYRFAVQNQWRDLGFETIKRTLAGPATEWEGRRFHMQAKSAPIPTKDEQLARESISDQLKRLRNECRMTSEELAECIDVDVSTVNRHLSGAMKPQIRQIGKYERVFTKRLKRQVLIEIAPTERT